MNDLNAVIGFLKEATDEMHRANYEASEQAKQDRKHAARTIIHKWMIDNDAEYAEDMIESEDGELAAELLKMWPKYNFSEVIVETRYFEDGFLHDLLAAMPFDQSHTKAKIMGERIAKAATKYVLSCHLSDAEWVVSEWQSKAERDAEDRICAAEAAWEARMDR